MTQFKDKVVVITGASSGIGKALAEQFLNMGAKVAVCARDLSKLSAVFEPYQIKNVYYQSCDVSVASQAEDFINNVFLKWGSIDILINNAGMSMRALFEDVDLSVLRKLMDVNYWGTVYMTKFALPSIINNKGTIVGISSIAGYKGLPGRTGYSSSKFAMNGFLDSVRVELLHKGVNVLVACPGFTSSNIRNTAIAADGKAQKETPLDESKLMSSEECASIIINGISKRKRTIVMTGQGKLTVFLSKFLPKMLDKLVFNHFKKEPNSPLK